MNRLSVSLLGGAIIALTVYLAVAVPQYSYWEAHQPHTAVVSDIPTQLDSPHLSLAQPKPQPDPYNLIDTVPNPTSFPPSAAFVLTLPMALIGFLVGTPLIWFTQFLSGRKATRCDP